jgi:L-ascorbate metabolism protein UlaG (beta-lactamase superfamily)
MISFLPDHAAFYVSINHLEIVTRSLHMSVFNLLTMVYVVPLVLAAAGKADLEKDTIPTSKGDLRITFVGHATLMFEFGGTTIHVDPVSTYTDYTALPKADAILITHEHGDHLDKKAIDAVSTKDTVLLLNEAGQKQLKSGEAMKNGETKEIKGIKIEAVPAYNIVNTRGPGQPYHPKGNGNGYVITFGDKKVYVAGDTENIPEMANLKDIEVAFLPMNLPYTMTPEMVAEAAKVIKPKILYPYHFGETDTAKLQALLKDTKGIEVRIRKLK